MGENNTNAFSAFVSYSHADKTAAQKLHRKLEGYRLPKHVAAQLSDRDDPAKLGQIFRDREDLPAAEDLSESVKAALAQSQALVVLCSPAAKASPWVAREIETFRKLHPNRPVLAALLEGEPEEAFPQPLMQGKEPLAADLRKEGDGSRLGFLKIVAGIAGVPLDALVQRDAQRRVRRVMLITGGAVLAMLAMAIMTVIAIQSRNEAREQRAEAQHQQAQADGIISFLLGDLREDLKGVGRLDIMTAVNERAMKYYENQADLSALPAKSLEKRAFILHAWGEDDEKRGDPKAALRKFLEAHRTTLALMQREPKNPDRIFAHAQSEYWVGNLHREKGDFETATRNFEIYEKLARQLATVEKSNRSRLEQAYANNNLGIMLLSHDDAPAKARMRFEKELAAYDSIGFVKLSVTEKMYYTNSLDWIATTYFVEDAHTNSLQYRQRAITKYRELLEASGQNKEASIRLARSLRVAALSQSKLGNLDKARAGMQEAYDRVNSLVQNDPANDDWQDALKNIREEKLAMEGS